MTLKAHKNSDRYYLKNFNKTNLAILKKISNDEQNMLYKLFKGVVARVNPSDYWWLLFFILLGSSRWNFFNYIGVIIIFNVFWEFFSFFFSLLNLVFNNFKIINNICDSLTKYYILLLKFWYFSKYLSHCIILLISFHWIPENSLLLVTWIKNRSNILPTVFLIVLWIKGGYSDFKAIDLEDHWSIRWQASHKFWLRLSLFAEEVTPAWIIYHMNGGIQCLSCVNGQFRRRFHHRQ